MYPSIDVAATGRNIHRLMQEHGYTVRDVQKHMGFERPQAIYHWLSGKTLPKVDNLCALALLFDVSVDEILVKRKPKSDEGRGEYGGI